MHEPITQAICEYRKQHGIDGPLFLGIETHALSASAFASALEVLAGNDVNVMIDDRDGTARFYDVNALSNFVANPLDVLGWDPHERLVDRIEGWLKEVR